ncbi:MAG: hypothetical protein RLZZ283_780 [Candidatus Parcubacteria bacterium]|jgi:hypothetical protein
MTKQFKIAVHVPVGSGDKVREAIGRAGGGKIGNYSFCSFTVRGTGRFRPEDGANPHIGSVGKLEEVEEESIEVVVGVDVFKDVIAAIRSVHPYDEPAIEVYQLADITGC